VPPRTGPVIGLIGEVPREPTLQDKTVRLQNDFDYSLPWLETLITRLEYIPEAETVAQKYTPSTARRGKTSAAGTKIFIVHGHDDGAKNSVARFIRSITGLEPVILHEQPDQGRTIIEKLEHYSRDVGFAIVLLTPDDLGAAKEAAEGHGVAGLKPRVRQNVMLELGYFLAHLGRSRMCALTVLGVEVPSDYQGVLFVPIDSSGGWKLTLARELQAAKYEIDTNKLLTS